jgi:ABC-type lipoprotein release transport system permease subunit
MFTRSIQIGGYKNMIEAGTGLLHGQIQVQHLDYLEDAKFEHLFADADALARRLAEHPRVLVASPRAVGFALLSVDEKSFGAQILGVDPEAEPGLSTLPGMVTQGRYLASGEEAYVGSVLARNLRADVGDELLVLSTGHEGGMVALALTIVGIFESGMAELDRALVEVPLDVFRDGFFLTDQAHQIVLELTDVDVTNEVASDIESWLPAGMAARRWQDLMPEIEQGIALDKIFGMFMFAILVAIVLFSIVNSFIMTVFERTREFGMLLAVGMRPWSIIVMLQLEALWLSILGSILGAAAATPILAWVVLSGIPLGDTAQAAMTAMHVPDRMYGAFDVQALGAIPLIFLVACQLAAFFPAQRVRRLQPVEALRVD